MYQSASAPRMRLADLHISPSVCVPRVPNNVTKKCVADIFDELDLGEIESIELVQCEVNGKQFKKIYVRFNCWFENAETQYFLETIQNGDGVDICHDDIDDPDDSEADDAVCEIWRCFMSTR